MSDSGPIDSSTFDLSLSSLRYYFKTHYFLPYTASSYHYPFVTSLSFDWRNRTIMIFVWSSEGGPLQYIGLALFVLQIFMGSSSWHFSFQQEDQQQQNPDSSPTQPNVSEGDDEGVLPEETVLSRISPHVLILLMSIAILLIVLWDHFQRMRTIWHQLRPRLFQDSNFYSLPILVGAGSIAGAAAYYLLANHPSILFTLFQLFPIGYFLYFQVLLPQLQPQQQNENNNNPQTNTSQLNGIVEIVSKLPVEEYISNSKLDTLTIKQLQAMLRIRKGSSSGDDEGNKFVERHELQDAVKACRTNESCCICFEDYTEGDALRVLPNCHHDFHLECIDQWAYTFATRQRSRSSKEPSCPLCKTVIRWSIIEFLFAYHFFLHTYLSVLLALLLFLSLVVGFGVVGCVVGCNVEKYVRFIQATTNYWDQYLRLN